MMNLKKNITILICLFISVWTFGQSQKISGVVVDASGEPIIGATVRIEDSNKGSITDLNGSFGIEAPLKGKLIVSYVGYITKSVLLDSKISNYKITLVENSKELDELVVVGYGVVKKSDLTGSVGKLTTDNAEEKAYSSMEQMMQGKVSGVQITQNTGALGSGMSFNIRGSNSVTGSNQPLIVIDGYPVESGSLEISTGSEANYSGDVPAVNALASLNPNDIASIEILKDASSTAIYGSRGANGVVLITTKRGKEGRDKVQYSFRTDVSYLPKTIDMLNSLEYMAYSNEAYLDKKDGTVAFDAAAIEKYKVYNTDWQDLIYRTGISQSHQLNVSGGDKKMQYALALGYLSQEGIVLNTSFDRGNIRLNLDREMNSRLKFSINMDGSMSMNKSVNQAAKSSDVGASIVSAALRTPPIYAAYNDTEDDIAQTTGVTNPLILVTRADDKQRTTQIKVSGNADYRFTKYFYLRVRAGINTTSGLRQYYMPRGTYLGDTRLGYAYEGNIRNMDYLTEYTLNFYKTIKKKHNFGIVGGYTWQNWLYRSDGVSASGFPNDNFTYYNLSSATTVDKPVNKTTEWSLASFLGRFNYSYDRRYMVTLTARSDGASRLAAGHKWDLFPSLALGWNAHNEKFLKDVKQISELKLRASYGISGNQSVAVGSTQSRYDSGTGVVNEGLVTIYYPANMSNENLKWETTKQINAGMDLGLWAGRVTFSIDYYYKRTSDLLINLPVPESTGYTTYTTNSGEVENKGLDLDLSGNILTGKLKWKASGNISFNRNKVLSFDGQMQSFMGPGISAVNNQPLNIAKVGYPIGSFYGYKIDGIYQTQEEIDNGPVDPANPVPGSFKFVDVNGDGSITDADRTVIGNPYPDYIFGVNNDFTWKNFALNVFIQGSIGQDVVNVSRYYSDGLTRSTSSNVRQEAWENRWTGPGTSNTYPVARANSIPFEGRFTNFIVEDASYVRLKSLTLSYNFKLPKMKFIENISLFGTGGNLLTLTKYKGYDPEINSRGTNSLTPGLDLGSIPQFRTYSLGFKVGLQ